MSIVAIDPGLSGGMAFVPYPHYSGAKVWDLPYLFKMVDPETIKFLLAPYEFDVVVFEKPQWRRGLGAKSVMTTFFNYGRATSAFTSYLEVEAQTWKKDLGLSKDKKESLDLARELFPHLVDELKRMKDNGRAEALLIGHWCLKYTRGLNES